MVQIVLVGFLPNDHGRSCEAHPYGCGNALIEEEGNGVGHLICLHLVEKGFLAGYAVKNDCTDGCHVVLPHESIQVGKLRVNSMVPC
jgi:hypothetical protein